MGKLFTRVLNNGLGEWAETYGVLIEAQAGFRAGMSMGGNIFVLHSLISHMLNNGHNYIALSLILRKLLTILLGKTGSIS